VVQGWNSASILSSQDIGGIGSELAIGRQCSETMSMSFGTPTTPNGNLGHSPDAIGWGVYSNYRTVAWGRGPIECHAISSMQPGSGMVGRAIAICYNYRERWKVEWLFWDRGIHGGYMHCWKTERHVAQVNLVPRHHPSKNGHAGDGW